MKQLLLHENWHFRQAGQKHWYPAKVPGTVHSDLLHNQLIDDPKHHLNENDVQWVEECDWEYLTLFTVNYDILAHNRIELVFGGIDTYADVYLNNNLILSSDNMFMEHRVDCKQLLKAGKNELHIYFHSPVNKGMDKLRAFGQLLPAPNELAPENRRTSVFSRKAPFHYGWDWGQRLVTSCIWRPIKLQAWKNAIIEDTYVETKSADKRKAVIAVSVDLEVEVPDNYTLSLWINGERSSFVRASHHARGKHKIYGEVTLENPRLWWPHGLGNPYLYDFGFFLHSEDTIIHQKMLKVGVRTVKLVQKPDTDGHTFYFEVNSVPVFMKGANIIPGETLTPAVSETKYIKLINSALQANMNMLRVWGGGIYEEDLFYDLCDASGLLVWQDFMFACAMQPGDKAHLESIRKEAEHNVKRLRNHACLALWCGNNEILLGWHNWGWQEAFDTQSCEYLWKTYEKIFHEILPAAVSEHDPKTGYWPSSPATIDNRLPDRSSGDEHDWTVWFGQKPLSAYWDNVPRFVSEWGVQAFPSMHTIRSFASETELNVNSAAIRHRQRSRMDWLQKGFDGNDMIRWYVEQYYGTPKEFEHLVYLSQVFQAEAYKTAIEAHRTVMPHCMGSLYWQLNDCWPTISWATVDYFGRWKAAHFAVKKAFQPIIITAQTTGKTIQVFSVSEKQKPFDAVLQAELQDFDGNIHYSSKQQVKIASNTSQKIFEKDFSNLITDKTSKIRVLKIRLLQNNRLVASNLAYFARPKELQLLKPSLTYNIYSAEGGFKLKIKSKTLVKNLYIDINDPNALFSDNFFDLLPQQPIDVYIKSNVQDLKKNTIRVKHLNC